MNGTPFISRTAAAESTWNIQAERLSARAAADPDRDLDQLLARGVLTEQAPADEWDVCSDCECGLAARQIQCIEGDLIAACPLDHARDTRLDAHDLRSFSINAAAIADEIAAASGFGERPSEIMPGVWYLGRTPTKRSLFIALGRGSVLAPA